MRLVETAKGAFQSLFQRDRVHQVSRRKESRQSPENGVHFRLLKDIGDGLVPPYSVVEYTTGAKPISKEGKGTRAILVGLVPQDPYSGVRFFLLDEKDNQTPDLVRETSVTDYKVVGDPTQEQLDLLETELRRIDSLPRKPLF